MGKKRVPGWYIREIKCANGINEKRKYYDPGDGAKTPDTDRSEARRLRKDRKNDAQAKHDAALQVNNNFRVKRDYFLTLTVSDEGLDSLVRRIGSEDPDALLLEMWHELDLLVRRAQYALRGQGKTFKYFGIASDMDGRTGEYKRVHLHMIVSRDAAQAVADAWKLGEVMRMSRLYSAHHGDLTDLVEYMLSQVRRIKNMKRYKPSRNLVAPAASKPRAIKNPHAPLRVPKGCEFIWRSEQREGGAQTLRYYRPTADDGGGDDDDLDS